MIKFLFRTLLVAAVGCLLLWFGLPQLHARAPETYAALARGLTGREPSAAPAETGGAAVAGAAGQPASAAPGYAAASAPPQVVAVSTDSSGAVVTTNVYASLDEVPEGMQVVSVPPPEPEDPRAALNDDPGFGWAVVIKNAPYFDKDMRRLGTLKGGSVVAHRTVVMKDEGEVVSCRVLDMQTRKWRPNYVVMLTSDLIRFDVPYAQTQPSQRDAAIDYFTVNGRLEALRERARASLPTNPYESEYLAAKEKYEALQTEINQMNREVRSVSGARRQALLQRLNEYRPKQTAALREFNPIKERYESWEQDHPDAATAEIPVTPEMRALQSELDRLRPSVSSFISGL